MQALALVDAPDHVCSRYRIRAFEPALAASGWSLRVEGLAPGIVRRMIQGGRASRFDAVILQRKLLPGWQLALLRRRARRLVFDFDDAVLYRDSYDPRGPHCRRRSARFTRVVRLADAVIAGNGFLAECAIRAGARPDRVRVIPTCVDADRYDPARHDRRGEGVELVWIGSSSTLRGLESQRPLWERLGREVPGLRLRVIADRFPDFGPLPVLAIPWSEPTEAAELAAGDVGIGWVPDDLWSRGKCGLKVLQYQAAGLPVVANPVGVHAEMIEPGVSGFLARTADEWVGSIRSLASNPGLRKLMGFEARSAVLGRYSVSAWAPTFAATLAGVAPPPGPKFESTRASARANRPAPARAPRGA